MKDKKTKEKIISKRVLKLMGATKLPKDFNYKTSLSDSLIKKYGNNVND